MDALWGAAHPVHNVCYEKIAGGSGGSGGSGPGVGVGGGGDDSEGCLCVGLAGSHPRTGCDFELHALFHASVLPTDAFAAARRLLASIRRDTPALFITRPLVY